MVELLCKTELDTVTVFNDLNEKQVKLRIGIEPSNDIRTRLSRESELNNGVDYCIVIDKNIDRMREVIDSISGILVRLRDIDTMSIVTYTDSPQVIVDSATREDIKSTLDILERGIISNYKKSNLHLALKQARQILENKSQDRIKKAILISNTEEEINPYIVNEVFEYGKESIIVDCIAIGEDTNYSILEQIASRLGGITNLIKQYTEVDMPIRESINRCKNAILTNVKMKIKFNPSARIRHIYRGKPANSYIGRGKSDNELVVNIGNVEINRMYEYYFDMAMNIKPEIHQKIKQIGTDQGILLAKGIIEYNVPLYDNKKVTFEINPQIVFTNNQNKIKKNEDVSRGYCEVEITKLDNELSKYAAVGDKTRVMYCVERIVQNCNKIGNTDLLKQYIQIIKYYEETGLLDKKMLSGARSSSSKPSNSSVLQPVKIDANTLERIKSLTK